MTKTKVTKENAPKPPGIYTNDDGSQTLIGPDGKEIKNPYADLYLNPDFLGYNTIIKPTLSFLNNVRKDLGYAVVGATALPKVVFNEVGNFIRDENQRIKMQMDDKVIIWSEKHNKYMSKYELKLQETIDAKQDMENNGGQL
tara:strand:- start:104 stop:529 length:426 start_codon:yes stop_codon:yes gene_type:complete